MVLVVSETIVIDDGWWGLLVGRERELAEVQRMLASARVFPHPPAPLTVTNRDGHPPLALAFARDEPPLWI